MILLTIIKKKKVTKQDTSVSPFFCPPPHFCCFLYKMLEKCHTVTSKVALALCCLLFSC